MRQSFPPFYADIPVVRLYDPLAHLLGASADGVLEIAYADVVKLAGHSCPTVASAYAVTQLALVALYGDAMPERGAIQVAFAGTADEGVTGVIAAVVSMLTGAAGEGGFKGIAGRYARRGLLAFASEQPLEIRFRRTDNGAAVDVGAYPGRVPAAPEMSGLLQRCIAGLADEEEARRFGALWQDRVRRILLEHGDDPEVFVVRPAFAGASRQR